MNLQQQSADGAAAQGSHKQPRACSTPQQSFSPIATQQSYCPSNALVALASETKAVIESCLSASALAENCSAAQRASCGASAPSRRRSERQKCTLDTFDQSHTIRLAGNILES